MSFTDLGLSAELIRALHEQNYTDPTPIQQQAIPPALNGEDILAGAQTGTGKTAAFALPLLQQLASNPATQKRRPIRALVLTPTRELAAQVHESIATYGQHVALRSAVVFGGVGIHPQIAKLRRGVDILVATPGRLIDLHEQNELDLSAVKILVLDEADRMLDMGFIPAIRKIMAMLPKRRQNLLFSATFSSEINGLAKSILHNPIEINVAARNTAAERVEQLVHPVDKARKRALLAKLITEGDWRQILVFARTKHGANRLAEQLGRDGINSAAIHGNKSQAARTKALADFKSGRVRALVATEVAARGLDIDQLPHVVNYELPQVPEDYIHRIGRTGRAGAEGIAVSLVCCDEHKLLRDIEKLLGKSLPKETIDGFEPDPSIKPEPIISGRQQRPSGGRQRNSKPQNASAKRHNGPRPAKRQRANAAAR